MKSNENEIWRENIYKKNKIQILPVNIIAEAIPANPKKGEYAGQYDFAASIQKKKKLNPSSIQLLEKIILF
ncbi:hypothetical protein AYI68_g6259 [Smittium mucronatum]|uniref:Uncharacterized protein n=1 Tax=Smittium mucronatum TaxID=133383 RepID=A0A1R0GS10_9FUNG|nr:hypothetical protein AYI68_g6259 [Smittium mucronatum]